MTKRRPPAPRPRRWNDRLDRALLSLAIRGERVRCSDPVDHLLWTALDGHSRCLRDPTVKGWSVFDLCGLAAWERNEKWGVFAGVDFTRKTGRANSVSA
jgi:hypothetical protein